MNFDLCRKYFLNEKGSVVLCGFSGGADSMAALLISEKISHEIGFRLLAVHFDHGLRDESAAEAEFCELFCRERGIEFMKLCLNVPRLEHGVENAAREARLKAWKQLAGKYNCSCVVTGHHANDKAENLFLRLFRGSNVSGLTGLRGVSVVENVRFIRPLIDVSRKEIEEFLTRSGITAYVTDSSNSDTSMLRNYLRNELLPSVAERAPFAAAGISRSLHALECDADFIEKETAKAFSCGKCHDLKFWNSLHDAIAIRVLRKFIFEETGRDFPVPAAFFERFKKTISTVSGEPRIIPADDTLSIIIQNETVNVLRDKTAPLTFNWQQQNSIEFGDISFEWHYTGVPERGGAETASFDADELGSVITLSYPENGERFVPFGSDTPISIKKLRVDRKIPAYPALPVFRRENGEPVWLPFIRNGKACAVTSETSRIITFYASRRSKS